MRLKHLTLAVMILGLVLYIGTFMLSVSDVTPSIIPKSSDFYSNDIYAASCNFSYPSLISANFDFPLSVTIYGNDGDPFRQSSNISLSNSNFHYTTLSSLTQILSNSIANFSI